MKRTVIFKDATKSRVSVTFEIETKKGNKQDWETLETVESYKTMSMTGIKGGGCGQIDDDIKPATANQKRLLSMWKEWHLNDVQAGTKAQTEHFESESFKSRVKQFDSLFDNSVIWKKSVEEILKSNCGKKFRIQVNRGRGHEAFVSIDKDGNVKGIGSSTFTLTADDKKYAQEQFKKYIDDEKKIVFRNRLPLCINEFFDNYDAEDGRELDAVISVEKFAKNFSEWYDSSTLKLVPYVSNNYSFRCLMLKLAGLFKDRGYEYGHGWLLKQLPEDIEDQINKLCDDIEKENAEMSEQAASAMGDFEGADWTKNLSDIDESDDVKYLKALKDKADLDDARSRIALALGKALGESAAEVVDCFDEDDASNCLYKFGADEYYVGTLEEMESEAKSVMKDSYRDIWADSAKAGYTVDSFADWIDGTIEHDGFASILDHYDGEGLSAKVDGKTYYICRP